jgi:microcystin-dependent protein
MAGTLPIALTQQFTATSPAQPMAGALLYFFQAGTVATPQDSFQDFGLTLKNPNPLPADNFGRIPMFYLADGQIHVRLTDASGVVVFDYPNMQVIGPSSGGGGGGGGGSVDPTTVAATGDVKFRATSESLAGWVKVNSTTIGSPSSGASQRANADTQNLYVYLWGNFTNAHCPVAGGRGANGLADFNANKTIQLPDWRARVLTGLDDMGTSAAGIILASNVTSGGGDGPTTPAASGGEANHTLVVAEMPSHTHTDAGHLHSFQMNPLVGGASGSFPGQGSVSTSLSSRDTASASAAIQNTGGNGVHNTMSPFVLGTFFIKL